MMDFELSQYHYDCGYQDGYNGTDDHDAAMSYGSQDEIASYHAGVEAGTKARLKNS